jgi:hypothetical protein
VSRFECKYFVPHAQCDRLRRWIEPFVQPDRHALGRPGHRYPICSLYLDTADLRLYRMTTEGIKNRFKLRVRSYSEQAADPLYFEIKRRIDGMIDKSRVALDRRGGGELLGGRLGPTQVTADGNLHVAETFMDLARRIGAGPVVRVRYEREAYESAAGDPVRLTLDWNLACAPTTGCDFSFSSGRWHQVPTTGIILEIKFTEFFPPWVADLIRQFQLQKISIPKYILSIKRSRRASGQLGPLFMEV